MNKERIIMKLSGSVDGEIERLKCLRYVLQKNCGLKEDIKLRIKYGWMKWRGILCYMMIPIMLEFFKTVVTPAII